MSEVHKPPGYMTEDLELRVVSGPPRYLALTEGPVEYLSIAIPGGVVVGYIYANDEDDVVGWLSGSALDQQAAHSAYFPWMMKLRACKARGLLPSAALDELLRDDTGAAVDPRSHVVPGSRRRAPSLAALREAAETAP